MKMKIFIATISTLLVCTQVSCTTMEQTLLQQMMDKYEKIGVHGRPVAKDSDKLDVTFGLVAIDGIVEKEFRHSATVAFTVWHRYIWNDVNLVWNPDDFGGVRQLHIPLSAIWTPDVKLYNSLGVDIEIDRTSLAVVQHDGRVLAVPRAKHIISCPKKGAKLACRMKFGSWTYHGKAVDLIFYGDESAGHHKTDINVWSSKELAVVNTDAVRNSKKYPCCPEDYIDLEFNLYLERK